MVLRSTLLKIICFFPILVACSSWKESEIGTPLLKESESSENITQIADEEKAISESESLNQEYLVSPQQLGLVRLGMTVEDVKKLYPQASYHLASLPGMPQVVAVREKDRDIFYFLAASEQSGFPENEAVIRFLATKNPRFQTAANISPNNTLETATEAYGEVKLYYSPEVEYAQFEHQPATAQGGMGFWVEAPKGEKAAGVYNWSDSRQGRCQIAKSGFCESKEFQPGSKITYISIGGRY